METTQKKNKTFTSKLIFIVVLLLVISFGLRFYFMQFREVIDTDGVYYAMLGKNLLAGSGYTEPEGIYQWYYPPVFPVHIGLVWSLLNDIEAAGEWVSIIYGTLLPLAIFFFASMLYDFKTGIIAGFLTAIFFPLIEFSSSATAESIFTFYTVILACIGYRFMTRGGLFMVFMLGLFAGILYLIKPAGIQYFGVAALFIGIGAWCGEWNKKAIIKGGMLFFGGWALLSIPYMIFLYNHHGYFTLSELSTRNIYRSVLVSNGESKEKEYELTDDKREMVYFTSPSYSGKHLGLFSVFKTDPALFLSGYFRNFVAQIKRIFLFGHFQLTSLFLLLMLAFGLLKMRKSRHGALPAFILASLLLPFLTYPLVSSEAKRWLLPFIAILNILYAKGIVELQEVVGSWEKTPYTNKKWGSLIKRYSVYLVVIGVMCFETAILMSQDAREQQKSYPVEHKEMGLFMKAKQIPKKSIVMSITAQTAFYAETRQKTIPWGEYPDILQYAKYHSVDYLVIDETFIPRRRPQLAFLLDEKNAPSELELIATLIGKNGRKIILYKLLENS